MSETRTRDRTVGERRPIPGLQLQVLGVELTLFGGILVVAVPLMGIQSLVAWLFLIAGLVVTLTGTFR